MMKAPPWSRSTSKWAIGIDPGFGGTGAVLIDHKFNPVAWTVVRDTKSRLPTSTRSMSIAKHIAVDINGWVRAYKIDKVAISIEMPFFHNNMTTYYKQVYLIATIENLLYETLPTGTEIGLVNPVNSKQKSTGKGNANKLQMIAASPHFEGVNSDSSYKVMETLADAWAHACCAWDNVNYAVPASSRYYIPEVLV